MKARILQEAILDVIDSGRETKHSKMRMPWTSFYENPDKEITEDEANNERLVFSIAVIDRYRELFRMEKAGQSRMKNYCGKQLKQ